MRGLSELGWSVCGFSGADIQDDSTTSPQLLEACSSALAIPCSVAMKCLCKTYNEESEHFKVDALQRKCVD